MLGLYKLLDFVNCKTFISVLPLFSLSSAYELVIFFFLVFICFLLHLAKFSQ